MKLKFALQLMALLCCVNFLFAQTPGKPFNWVLHFGGGYSTSYATDGPETELFQPSKPQIASLDRISSTAADADGNTYAILDLWGTVKLGTVTYTAPAAAHHSVPLLLKYSKTGAFLWAQPLYTAGKKMLQRVKVTVDATKSPVIAGTYSNTDATGPDIKLGTKTIPNTKDVVVAKFNGSGTCLYVKTFDITWTHSLYVKVLDSDGAGNIYLATSQDKPTDQEVMDEVAIYGDEPGALRKLNSSLSTVWEKVLSKDVDISGGSVNSAGNILIGFKFSYHQDPDTASFVVDKKAYSWRLEKQGILYHFDAAGKVKFTTVFKNSELPVPYIDNAGNGYFVQANTNEDEIGKNPYGIVVNYGAGKYPLIKIGPDGALVASKYFNGGIDRNPRIAVNKITGEVFMATDFTNRYFYSLEREGALTHGDFTFYAQSGLHYIALLKYDTDLTEAGGFISVKNASAVAVPSLSVSPGGNLVLACLADVTPPDSHDTGPAEPITIGNATYKAVKDYDGFLMSIAPNAFVSAPTTTWTGKSGTSWAVASNWSNGVPNVSSRAIIPTGLTNYPKVLPKVAYAGILEIGKNVGLNITQSLQVKGVIKNNGTLTYNPQGAFYLDVNIEGTGVTNITSKTELSWYATGSINQKLILNNTERIVLRADLTTEKLQLNGAPIYGSEDGFVYLTDILSDAADALTGYSSTRYINGRIRRAIAGSGSYVFPVKKDIYAPLTLSFAANTSTASILVDMVPPDSAPNFYNTKINGVKVKSLLYNYAWEVIRDSYQTQTGTVEARLEVPYYTGMPATNYLGLLTGYSNHSFEGAPNWQQPQVITAGSNKTLVAKLDDATSLRVLAIGVTTSPIPDLRPTITSFTPTASGKGTSVIIKGTNFTGATAVSFGGTPATSFSVASATTITAIVGSGASGDVMVTTPNGKGSKAGFTFINAPTITSFTPTTAGKNATVTIKGTNFTGATAVAFGGKAAASFTVSSANSITAVVSSAGTSGKIEVTTPGGKATSTNSFNYIGPAIVTSFSPTSAGPGATVVINGKNFTGTTGLRFGGTIAKSFTVNSDTKITAVIGEGSSGIISVYGITGLGTLDGFTFLPKASVYPNPFTQTLTVNIGDKVYQSFSAKVYNISTGRMLFSKTLSNQSGRISLNLAPLNDGTYTLNVTLDGQLYMFKIIKKN